MVDEEKEQEVIAKEDLVRERVDDKGDTWRKVYFGGGAHFRNWLDQVIELRGKDNVQVEEIHAVGLKCFEDGGEKTYRIWVREQNASA
ncbi:MAG: hypothetical protein V3S51_04045 [Dehalococcoidia bacterium]